MNTTTNTIHALGLDVADEGGSAKRIGNKVEVTFVPQVKPSDITDRTPDDHLNPNSFRGACELSAREQFRKSGGREIAAALSNVVNQGMVMAEIDKLRFDTESRVVGVRKRANEPFIVEFADEAAATAFEQAITT